MNIRIMLQNCDAAKLCTRECYYLFKTVFIRKFLVIYSGHLPIGYLIGTLWDRRSQPNTGARLPCRV